MSKLLEHIIRQALFEQTTDWDITIEFSQPDGDGPGRVLRYQTAQNNAEKVGAIAGVAVVAKARRGVKNPTSNVSEIIKEIVRMMESNPGHVYGKSGKYNNKRYLYVLATVKSKRKRKIFNLMVFDRSKLGRLVQLLANDNLLDKELGKFQIGHGLPVLSDDQFALYISRLKRLVKETNDTEINKVWKESGLEQVNLDAMRSSIKDPEHDTGAEAVGKIVNLKNKSLAQFTGKAVTVFDPRESTVSYEAINGECYLYYGHDQGSGNSFDKFKFKGDFKDGIPHNGTLEFIETNKSIDTTLHIKTYKGTLTDPGWTSGLSDVVSGGQAFDILGDENIPGKFKLIEAEQAVYDIGLTYKGTYNDNLVFDTGVLTQTVDSTITAAVDASRYKGFNLTKRLIDHIESSKYGNDRINTLPRTSPVRIAVKIAVANCKTITAKIESTRFKYADFVDSENKNILEDMYGEEGRLNTIFKNLNSKLGKPFKQETGDLPYKSIKEGSTDYKEFDPRPKKYIIQLNLLDTIKIDGVSYYQFEYFDTELNSIQPMGTIKFYAEASQFNKTFIKAQQELGNIK